MTEFCALRKSDWPGMPRKVSALPSTLLVLRAPCTVGGGLADGNTVGIPAEGARRATDAASLPVGVATFPPYPCSVVPVAPSVPAISIF